MDGVMKSVPCKMDDDTKRNLLSYTWKGKLASVVELTIMCFILFYGFLCFLFIANGNNDVEAGKNMFFITFKISIIISVLFGTALGLLLGFGFFIYKWIPVSKAEYLKYLTERKNVFEYDLKNAKNSVNFYAQKVTEVEKDILEVTETFSS